MRIVPRTGMVIINPATHKPLPVGGDDVELDTYWVRRLNDGDVAEVLPDPPPAEPPKRTPKARKGSDEGK